MRILHLTEDWQFKQRTGTLSLQEDLALSENWQSATVPGCVHLDLLAHELIPDPFYGLQEQEVQWVGEQDWIYRCQFTLPEDFFASDEHIILCFDGLDTFATVWLNDRQILISDNMFLPHEVQVTRFLQSGVNELAVIFASAWHQGKTREAQAGKSYPCWNGDSSRLYVRKAQYHYGWDWGPTLITAGIWRGVRLEAYSARIIEVHCPVEVTEDLESAFLPVQVLLDGEIHTRDLALHLELYGPDGELVDRAILPASLAPLSHTFELLQPRLWWPRGYGEQALYRLVVSLRDEEIELAGQELRLGLRRLQLIQRPLLDEPGKTFFFEINNTPIFCGGANWIPADSFGPRVTPERYRRWLELAAEGNMTMLRVWGGGYYEEDIFYDLCDELGLLVWQDFMFGCGLYPAPQWMQTSVRAEAIANVRRLRHHPSLVIWAGNNEDYALAKSVNAYDPDFVGDFATSAFPARALYEGVLPDVCGSYDSTRPYWPGSPFGSTDDDVNNRTIGDQHIWTIWGRMVPYQDYPKFAGRFISEFGMESFPDRKTIESFAPEEERYAQSRTLDHHHKSDGGPSKIAGYIIDNFRMPADLEGYIYVTQLLQAEAMGVGIRGWRRRWSGKGREYVAGALIWQLNDCWPVTSWALVDCYLRVKPAYYVVKRELAPFVAGLAKDGQGVAVWAVNGLTMPRQMELELRAWTVDGEMVAEERRSVELLPNQATELGHFGSGQQGKQVIFGMRLLENNKVMARTVYWPEPLKYLPLQDPDLTVERNEGGILQVRVKRPAKGVFFSAEKEVSWSDNMLDILPDDIQQIQAQGLGEAPIKIFWLGK